MAGGGGGDEDGLITGINVTPLVDVMLCLLVIFMVTTSYVVADSIKVDLPKASTGEGTEPSTLTLMYTKDHVLMLNGKKSSEAALRKKIREEIKNDKEVQAIIGADRAVNYGGVMHLIDVVKQEGVVKFALNIESVPLPAERSTDRGGDRAAVHESGAANAAAADTPAADDSQKNSP